MPTNIDNLTVTIALTDQAAVSNLKIVLIAPGGTNSIVLVENAIDATGKVIPGQGLPSGNAIGVYGFSPGATGTPGTPVDTIFDYNATRRIFHSTATGTNGNSAADYIGYFRPEHGPLPVRLAGGNVNGQWILEISNFMRRAPPSAPSNASAFSSAPE